MTRFGITLWMLLAGSAWAAGDGFRSSVDDIPPAFSASTGEPLFDFDLPALPLADALKRYGDLTRQPTLARSELLTGRMSSAVRGSYPGDAALWLMLEGTGLIAERIADNPAASFVLRPVDAAETPPRAVEFEEMAGYPGLVQSRVWRALCENVRTTPGDYRSLLRFRVAATGRLERVRLITSTGDADLDAAIEATLQEIRMDRPPPRNLAQPLTILIEPHDVAGGPRCDGAF